ncbi:MAG: HRDC domain-containing protein [Gammaproteobacteria bacterium]|nr:HRDC domain-containing protein [Gammaproteobacteria bacterium]
MTRTRSEFPIVDDEAALRQVTARVADASLVALDTEFVRERTYFPQLCLLQIATDDIVAAVDCLAELDFGPLFAALLADDRVWVLHSARQDLEVLWNESHRLPQRLIDTQVAAALLGKPIQVGLQNLLSEQLGIDIGKEHTRANWARRPLPEAQLSYALDDVRHLLPLWQALETELRELGRLDWFEEDCARILATPTTPDTATIFERTKGVRSLTGRRRAAAMALVAWRETEAQRKNRPRRWILSDEQLMQIATALPESQAALESLKSLPPKLVARAGRSILEAVAGAPPVDDATLPTPPDKAVVRALQTEIKRRAEKLGIQTEVLATRRDVSAAAAGRLPADIASGWRGPILDEVVGGLSRGRAS